MRTVLFLLLISVLALPALSESAGGLQWTAPANWKALPERPMRAATYIVPAAPGDKEDGECAVFYFGAGQGGGVQANIDRWVGQFQKSDGSRIDQPESKETKNINGLSVTTLAVSGTYLASSGPMMQAKTSKPGYRMLAAIVEGPGGSVFFKFTGPAKTVAAGEAAFQGMLKSLRK